VRSGANNPSPIASFEYDSLRTSYGLAASNVLILDLQSHLLDQIVSYQYV